MVIPLLLSSSPIQNSYQLSKELGPTLLVISHKPPSLFFTGWRSTELPCQLNTLTHQSATSCHFSQLNCGTSCLQDNFSERTTQKTQPLYCCRRVFTTLLHSNSHSADHTENTILLLLSACMLWALPSNVCCLETGLYTTILYRAQLILCLDEQSLFPPSYSNIQKFPESGKICTTKSWILVILYQYSPVIKDLSAKWSCTLWMVLSGASVPFLSYT
jgi:hypothetical protein